jgi:2-polyprenyl-3-methyl-5-hydroxy-6-metoxy-1,4-benzoquinol methylase
MASPFDHMIRHGSVASLRKQEEQKYDRTYFADHYWREDLPGLTGNRGLSYDDPEHRQRFSFLCDALLKANRPHHLLDAGCGPGFLLQEALTHGIDARGIDTSISAQELFDKRSRGLWPNRFEVGTIAKLAYPDRAFDLCVCLDVLEHLIVFDIFDAVRELCRVTSGELICSINLDNPYTFHPTILSRDTWIALFESTGIFRYREDRSLILSATVQARYPEYDLFLFSRVDTSDNG